MSLLNKLLLSLIRIVVLLEIALIILAMIPNPYKEEVSQTSQEGHQISREVDQSSSAYQAACHGSPLSDPILRETAVDDGYEINPRYNCIDKASYLFARAQKTKRKWEWAAANAPEAIAKRKTESAAQHARIDEYWQQKAAAEEKASQEALPNIVLRDVDVNTATEAEIANVITIGPETASQIIEERNKRRFNDWADLVNRVIPLSAAQTAVYASICGLNVNGKSLGGAPPNAIMAAQLYKKYQHYRKNQGRKAD